MGNETFKFILLIWGSGLSTILAFISLLKFFKENMTKLIIFPTVEPPFDQLKISAINNGTKPATITKAFICYGRSAGELVRIISKPLEVEKKLSESDRLTISINRTEIIEGFKKTDLIQKSFHRLWASVELSNGQMFNEPIYIAASIIQHEYYHKAEQYIAADLFLGFEQSKSEFYPIGIK